MVDILYHFPYGNRIYDSDESTDEESKELDYPDEDDVIWSDVAPARTFREDERWRKLLQRHSSPKKQRVDLRKHIKIRKSDNCCICLSGYHANEKQSFCSVECGTVFHRTCLDKYNKTKCPVCRKTTVFRQLLS
jgi:hypothetical protein